MQSGYQLYYYISPSGENPVSDFLDKLLENQQAKVLRIFHYIKEYGLTAILPHTRKLTGTSLWEIRILGKDNIRILYCVPIQNTVLILHGFIKKSNKTPKNEITTVLTRLQLWKQIHGIIEK